MLIMKISNISTLKYSINYTIYNCTISALTRFTQPVFVSREDPNSRQNTIKEIQCRAQSGGKWPQIIIFPEGTCTNRTCLISFKPGGFYPGVPIQPVLIRYPNKLVSFYSVLILILFSIDILYKYRIPLYEKYRACFVAPI